MKWNGLNRSPISRKPSPARSRELSLRSKLKKILLEECDNLCMDCGGPGDFRGLSLHHIKKLSQGGLTEKGNVTILCGECHDSKHGIVDKNT